MSTYLTYSSAGIRHLVVDEIARDGQVRGAPDLEEVQVLYQATQESTLCISDESRPEFTAEGDTLRFVGASAVRITVPQALAVTVRAASGDLRVQQTAGEVNLENVRGDLRLLELQGVVRVAQVAGDLRAEEVADLRVMGACDGDLRIEGAGNLAAESVAGDIRLQNAGEVRIGRVRGDLWAEDVRGALQVARADGDVRLSDIGGAVSLRDMGGDLRAGALGGGLSALQVNGDAVLMGPFIGVEGYNLSAEGDISLHLPADADVRLVVRAGGRLRSDPQLIPTSDGSPIFTATIARGTYRINLASGGDIRIHTVYFPVAQEGAAGTHARARSAGAKPEPTPALAPERSAGASVMPDLSSLGERIRQQVNASLAAAGLYSKSIAGPHGRRERARVATPAQPPRPGGERTHTPASPPPPSLDEQVAVLKMVEEGKISPEEADVLLKALGG